MKIGSNGGCFKLLGRLADKTSVSFLQSNLFNLFKNLPVGNPCCASPLPHSRLMESREGRLGIQSLLIGNSRSYPTILLLLLLICFPSSFPPKAISRKLILFSSPKYLLLSSCNLFLSICHVTELLLTKSRRPPNRDLKKNLKASNLNAATLLWLLRTHKIRIHFWIAGLSLQS